MALLKTVGLCKYFGGLKAVNHVDMEVQQELGFVYRTERCR